MNLTTWIVGSANRAEFRPVLEQLATVVPGTTMVRLPDVSAVEAQLAGSMSSPDLLLVCESWPDEFPANHVTRLLAAIPLARTVCITGTWCEAAGRTRSHWPPALRVPLWLANERIEQELNVLAGRSPALPWTATRDECVLSRTVRQFSQSVAAVARVEIYDPALRAEMTSQLEHLGCLVTIDSEQTVNFVLVAAEPASFAVRDAIGERCRAVAPAQVVAVTTWPLPEWCEQLRAAGVWAVVNPLEPKELSSALSLSWRAGRRESPR